MRNLKRALSLTLASVMLLGMMVVGADAASYPDVDAEDNVEAIEVLQAVQVMRGDDNGNFNPDSPVTRSEMAVVMALLLDLDYQYYEASCPFTDVPNWARPYVGACYANKIVSGYNATTYGANDGVTPVQAASMMMRALGYFQYQNDYADGFEVSTVRQGTSIGIFDDVGSSATASMTRNQVAQMTLNALECGMVEPSDNALSITTPDGFTVAQGRTNYVYVVGRDRNVAEAINKTRADSGNANSGLTGPILDLGEQLYQGDLRKIETTDDFGRPATRWTYKTNEVGVYVNAPSVYKSWTAKVAKNELYNLLGGSNANRLTLVSALDEDGKDQLIVYVDGAVQTDKAVKEYIERDNTGAAGGFAGKGVLTEVFQDNNNNVTLTFVNTYLMQATADYSESNKSVRVTTLTGPARDNVLKSEDFDGLESIKEDDYILYTYARNEIQSGQVAAKVTGEVTAYSVSTKANGSEKDPGDAGGSVTLDGTKRDYAKWAETDDKNGCAVEYKLGADASIVLDAYGYVIYVDDSSLSVGNYVYIYAIAPQTNLRSNFDADAFFTDGTRSTITVKELKAWTGTAYTANLATESNVKEKIDADKKIDGYTLGGWYSYSKNSRDEYTLEKAKTNNEFGSGTKDLKIENNRVNVGGKVAGDKNTIFVVLGPNNKVTSYTGIANVAEITNAHSSKSFYMKSKDDSGKNAIAVFIDASDGAVRNGNSDLLYLLDEDSHENRKDSTTGDTIYTWNVVLVKDGEASQTKIETIETNTRWAKKGIYKSYGVDSDEFYELVEDDKLNKNKTDDDIYEDGIDEKEISCDGETFNWGGHSYVVDGTDTRAIALVVYPDKSTDEGKALAKLVNMDEDADYKVYTGVSGRYIANMFRGYSVSGSIYGVMETDTDKVKSMIVVADGIKTGTTPTPPSTVTIEPGLVQDENGALTGFTIVTSGATDPTSAQIEEAILVALEGAGVSSSQIESVSYNPLSKRVAVKLVGSASVDYPVSTTKGVDSAKVTGTGVLTGINSQLGKDTNQDGNGITSTKTGDTAIADLVTENKTNLKALADQGVETITAGGKTFDVVESTGDFRDRTAPAMRMAKAIDLDTAWLSNFMAAAVQNGKTEETGSGENKTIVMSATLTLTFEIQVDGETVEASIDWTGKISGSDEVKAAATIDKVLDAANTANNAEKKGTATLNGSTITLTNSEALLGLDYVTPGLGVGSAAQATHDMVQFLVALNNDDTKATKIEYAGGTYTWDSTNQTEASKWKDSTKNESLVKTIGDKVSAEVTAAMKNDPTEITVNVGTLTATMADRSTLEITFVLQLNDIGKDKEAKMVTSAGAISYGTLKDMLAETSENEGSTITLQKNVEATERIVIPAGSGLILDLGGYALTGKDVKSGNNTVFSLIKIDKPGNGDAVRTVTIKNGDITNAPNYGIFVEDGAKLALVDVNVTGNGGIHLASSGKSNSAVSTLTITGGTIKTTATDPTGAAAIQVNGNQQTAVHELTVTGAVIEGGKAIDGMYLAGLTNTTLNNCTVSGANGISIKAGHLTVTGGSIEALSERKEPDDSKLNTNGSDIIGAPIAIFVQKPPYAALGTISVNGVELITVDEEKTAPGIWEVVASNQTGGGSTLSYATIKVDGVTIDESTPDYIIKGQEYTESTTTP